MKLSFEFPGQPEWCIKNCLLLRDDTAKAENENETRHVRGGDSSVPTISAANKQNCMLDGKEERNETR